jgi:hypothetical protein
MMVYGLIPLLTLLKSRWTVPLKEKSKPIQAKVNYVYEFRSFRQKLKNEVN